MSKEIYSLLPEEFIRRMRNWARACAGLGSLVYTSSSIFRTAAGERGERDIPILQGEAADTDDAIALLPVRYRQAIMLFWQYEGAPLAHLARRCGVGVDYRTYKRRVIDGHELLRAELARLAERRRQYRLIAMARRGRA